MQIFTYQIRPDTNLFLFGDDHEGVSARYDKGWNKLLNMMNSEYDGCSYNLGIDHGDCIEGILIDDKRYSDLGIKHNKVMAQFEQAIKNREPIKDKIVCLLLGNHDFKLWRFGHIAPMVAERLGIRFGDWTSVISYTDKKGRLVFKHYACHKAKNLTQSVAHPRLRRKTNALVSLQNSLRDLASDCFLMTCGHAHQLYVLPPTESLFLYSDGGHLKSAYTDSLIQQTGRYLHEDLRWYACCGSFLRSRLQDGTTYAEMEGLPPNQLGFLVAKIRDYKLVGIDEIRLV